MNDLIAKLRSIQRPGAESDLTVMCAEAADKLEKLRQLVEAVRDANARACSAGDRWHLSTEAQGQAWIRLMEAL